MTINNTVETNPNLTVYPSFKAYQKASKQSEQNNQQSSSKPKKTNRQKTLSASIFSTTLTMPVAFPANLLQTHKKRIGKCVYDNLGGDEQEKALYAAMEKQYRRNKAIYTDFQRSSIRY